MSQNELKPSVPDWRKTILSSSATLREVIKCMNLSSLKIVLIVKERYELEGTISDGDIRRGLLKGLTLDSPIDSVINRSALVVPSTVGREMILQLMVANRIQQIPVVDEH